MSAPNDAHQDGVLTFSQTGVIGTLGTADIKGTSLTIPVGVDPATGAMYVNNLGPAGSVSLGNTPGGTLDFIGSIATIGTLPAITTSVSPNLPVIAGTPNNAGTVISVRLSDGTTYYTASAGGSFTNVASGTLNVGTVVNNGGSVAISDGASGSYLNLVTEANNFPDTKYGIMAGARSSGIGTAGSVRFLVVDSNQNLKVADQGGTVNTGTINVGTFVMPSGTLNVGTVTATVTTGTINAGTINVGTVTATVTVGTVGGKAASGAAAAANPVQVAGTDSGGTIYSPLVTTAGVMAANMPSGTLNVGTINTGTVTATVTAGTINAGTINVGTVFNTQTIGTTNVGTMNTGTVNTGTINAGTINVGTITAGSIIVTVGTVSAGTINTGTINAGTFQENVIPTVSHSAWGTLGTTGVTVFGTIAGGTGSGAGTQILVTSLSLTIPSTAGSQNVSIGFGTNGGTFHQGTGALINGNFPPGGGIQKTYDPAVNSGTNGQLTYFQAGAGSVYVNATYITAVTSV